MRSARRSLCLSRRTNYVKYSVYEVKKGDTLSEIAEDFDISLDTLISINGFTSAKSLKPNQLLKVPNQSGIVYVAPKASSVQEIADSYNISADRIIDANGLLSENIPAGKPLFLPDVRLPAAQLREIAGTLFKWPVRGRLTSWFGWRKDPFTGRRSFHNAIDIAAPYGSPIGASMDGRVVETGYSPILGKYVMMSHTGGWKTTVCSHVRDCGEGRPVCLTRPDLGANRNNGIQHGASCPFRSDQEWSPR